MGIDGAACKPNRSASDEFEFEALPPNWLALRFCEAEYDLKASFRLVNSEVTSSSLLRAGISYFQKGFWKRRTRSCSKEGLLTAVWEFVWSWSPSGSPAPCSYIENKRLEKSRPNRISTVSCHKESRSSSGRQSQILWLACRLYRLWLSQHSWASRTLHLSGSQLCALRGGVRPTHTALTTFEDWWWWWWWYKRSGSGREVNSIRERSSIVVAGVINHGPWTASSDVNPEQIDKERSGQHSIF